MNHENRGDQKPHEHEPKGSFHSSCPPKGGCWGRCLYPWCSDVKCELSIVTCQIYQMTQLPFVGAVCDRPFFRVTPKMALEPEERAVTVRPYNWVCWYLTRDIRGLR